MFLLFDLKKHLHHLREAFRLGLALELLEMIHQGLDLVLA